MHPTLQKLLGVLFVLIPMVLRAEAPTRSEVLAIAASYAEHRWTATERNILHGRDSDKIEVQTPNGGDSEPPEKSRLWTLGRENIGVPYKWGGFDTLESFQRGLTKGRAAGDLYNAEKRRLGGAAVSGNAVGVDCSGYVSRCWKLSEKQSTSTLASISKVLPNRLDLRPGDVMNQAGGHVVLFVRWKDDSRTVALFYEAEPFSKVLLSERDTVELEANGFKPMRYRKIRE